MSEDTAGDGGNRYDDNAGFNDDGCLDNNDYGGNADGGDEGNNDDK